MPPMTIAEVQRISHAALARAARQELTSFSTPENAARLAYHVERWVRANQTWVPWESGTARPCFITSWANLAFTAPSFGPGTRTVAALPLKPGTIVLTVIDDPDRGWHVYGRMPKPAWDAVEKGLAELSVRLKLA